MPGFPDRRPMGSLRGSGAGVKGGAFGEGPAPGSRLVPALEAKPFVPAARAREDGAKVRWTVRLAPRLAFPCSDSRSSFPTSCASARGLLPSPRGAEGGPSGLGLRDHCRNWD